MAELSPPTAAAGLNATSVTSHAAQEYVTYALLCVNSLVCVYVGSRRSVRLHRKQKESSKPPNADVLTTRDAALFPLLASGILIAAYLVFVVISKEYTALLVTVYFFCVGIIAIYNLTQPLVKLIPDRLAFYGYQLSLKEKTPGGGFGEVHEFDFDCRDIFLILAGAAVSGLYAKTKHWLANNFIGSALCITTIQVLQLNKFVNGAILLSGLFVYDIFWVFGTNVMVSVAKNFEAPIKLVVPRDLFSKHAFSFTPPPTPIEFSMLGLGDIIVPGVYIALLLRFDQHLRKKTNLHFRVGLLFYTAALAITVLVVHVFHKAQPALLYIVPLMLLPTCIVAAIRGEWADLLAYTDHEEVVATEPGEQKKTD